MKHRNICALAVLLGWVSTAPLALASDQDPLKILQAASRFSSTPYQGEIISTIYHGSKTQRVKATIQIDSPERYKKEFFRPDGAVEKVIFSNQKEEWIYFPSKKLVWKGDLKKSQPKLISEQKEWELIAENYNITLKPEETIAGRKVFVLEITPKVKGKPHRTLWIDEDESLILKNKEYHPNGTLAVESTFKKIEFVPRFESETFILRVPTGTQVKDHGFSPDFLSLDELKEYGARFQVIPKHLPEGFVFESADFFNAKGKEISHLRFTDGLNVISLFESAYPVSTKTKTFSWEPDEFMAGSIGFPRAGKILHWKSGKTYFTLVGNLSSEALHTIAQSIK